jgi:hypothetical protein
MDEAVAVSKKEDEKTCRSSKVTRDMVASVRCYSEIVKEGKK